MAIQLDSKTVDEAVKGDKAALGQLLDASQHLIFNVCLRMLGDANDAAETAQDTMVKIIEHIREFHGQSDISTWITRIAMNQSISRMRKRKIRMMRSLDAPGAASRGSDEPDAIGRSIADDRELSPPDRVEKEEELVRLHAALTRIDEEYRAVLVLRDLQEMDYQQIAKVLEIPVGTVKSRLFRARAALRVELLGPLGLDSASGAAGHKSAE